MATLGNQQSSGYHPLRLDARKGFSFGIRIKDEIGALVDITGCELTIVMKAQPYDPTDTDDSDNLITNSVATMVDPTNGYARFDLQPSDLAVAGNYPYAISLTTAAGYPSTIVRGEAQILDNPEFSTISDTYTPTDPVQIIDIKLRNMVAIDVRVGTPIPPGFNYLSDTNLQYLSDLVAMIIAPGGVKSAAFEEASSFADADAVVPAGGFTGQVLTKYTGADYDIGWLNVSGLGGGLDATGIPLGYVPVALGTDLWEWQANTPINDADDISDGATKVIMLATERTKLTGIEDGAEVNVQSDWSASGTPAEILNKPSLDFAPSAHTHSLLDLSDITMGTVAPASSGVAVGEFYLRKKT